MGEASGVESVELRVYDISDGRAAKWSKVVLGRTIPAVYHTGILVFGREYFYGGNVIRMHPTDVELTYGMTPIKTHHLGRTSKSKEDFEKWLSSVAHSFSREFYDLTRWNCNHFTDHAAKFLVNRGIPKYVLDLPEEVKATFTGSVIIAILQAMRRDPPVDAEDPNHPRHRLRRRLCSDTALPSATATPRQRSAPRKGSDGAGAETARRRKTESDGVPAGLTASRRARQVKLQPHRGSAAGRDCGAVGDKLPRTGRQASGDSLASSTTDESNGAGWDDFQSSHATKAAAAAPGRLPQRLPQACGAGVPPMGLNEEARPWGQTVMLYAAARRV